MLAIGAAASCGTDVKSVKRGHPSLGTYPARLGHEFAGAVGSVGEGVTNVAPGDVVFCGNSAPCGVCRQCLRGRESLCEDLLYVLGGFAEQLLVPARVAEKNLHPLPRGRAARAGAAGRAARLRGPCPRRREPSPGRSRSSAAGSLGLMLAALVADAGGEPVVLDPHPERLAAARRFGAAHTIQATRGPATSPRRANTGAGPRDRGRRPAGGLGARRPDGRARRHGQPVRRLRPRQHVHRPDRARALRGGHALGTYHHAPRYLARALDVLAAAAHPWAELYDAEIDLEQLPEALARNPGKLSVRTAP